MKDIINNMFRSVEYWQDKKLLLRAIHPQYYSDKNIIIQLLGVTTGSITPEDEAKRSMWNHQIMNHKLGDDILKNVDPKLLDDLDFAKKAISKYNRTYIFLSHKLQASQELAMSAAFGEDQVPDSIHRIPILKYMPPIFQAHHEIALIATTRNIDNLQYATNLRRNKYFIIDIMNLIADHSIKQRILKHMDRDLLEDKRFISKLGCFDNLCEKFHGDKQYVSNAVKHDIKVLKKTKIFDELILKAALNNNNYHNAKEYTLASIFRYIEKFNDDYDELDHKVKDKKLLHKLFWEFGETVSDEFI